MSIITNVYQEWRLALSAKVIIEAAVIAVSNTDALFTGECDKGMARKLVSSQSIARFVA